MAMSSTSRFLVLTLLLIFDLVILLNLFSTIENMHVERAERMYYQEMQNHYRFSCNASSFLYPMSESYTVSCDKLRWNNRRRSKWSLESNYIDDDGHMVFHIK